MALGFYFNQNNCSGCMTCQVACKDRNNLPVGQLYRNMRVYEQGAYPNAHVYFYAKTCNHCENPACVQNCPTGAMFKDADGTVQHDDAICIGCKNCVNTCPYEVPVYFEDKAITGKCDACKPFRDRGLNPVCVDTCPTRALEFGDLDELRAKHEGELVNELPCLPSAALTGPNTLIDAKASALESDFFETFI